MSHFQYQCANCNQLFGWREAVCEDWRIPEKSFICPHCNAYLAKYTWREKLNVETEDPISNFGYVIIIVISILVGIFLYVYPYIESSLPTVPDVYRPYVRNFGWLVLVSVAILNVLNNRRRNNKQRIPSYEKTKLISTGV